MYPYAMPSSRNAYADDPVRWLHAAVYPHGDFVVTVHWLRTRSGRAVPARVEVCAAAVYGSTIGEPVKGAEDIDVPGLTGTIIRNLGIGTDIALSRDRAFRAHDEDDPDAEAFRAPAPTTYDEKRQRAAEVVWEQVHGAKNRRAPYVVAAQVLRAEGITARGGKPLEPRRLAKWIKEAEQRGEYPPPDRQETSE